MQLRPYKIEVVSWTCCYCGGRVQTRSCEHACANIIERDLKCAVNISTSIPWPTGLLVHTAAIVQISTFHVHHNGKQQANVDIILIAHRFVHPHERILTQRREDRLVHCA